MMVCGCMCVWVGVRVMDRTLYRIQEGCRCAYIVLVDGGERFHESCSPMCETPHCNYTYAHTTSLRIPCQRHPHLCTTIHSPTYAYKYAMGKHASTHCPHACTYNTFTYNMCKHSSTHHPHLCTIIHMHIQGVYDRTESRSVWIAGTNTQGQGMAK